MNTVRSATRTAQARVQEVEVRAHALSADIAPEDSAPSPHDYFDVALATCKALTAHVYAAHHEIPLERVETQVERDDAEERRGVYRLRVRTVLHGPLTDEQREAVQRAIAKCPIHKLMTATTVEIETLAP